MFGRIRSEFQCLEGLSQNSNVWKDNQLRFKLPQWCYCELQCTGQQSFHSGYHEMCVANVVKVKIR